MQMVHDFFLFRLILLCEFVRFHATNRKIQRVEISIGRSGFNRRCWGRPNKNSLFYIIFMKKNETLAIKFRLDRQSAANDVSGSFQLTFLEIKWREKTVTANDRHVRPDGALTRPVSISRSFFPSLSNGIADIY